MPTSTRAVGVQVLLKPCGENGRTPRADRVVRPYRTFCLCVDDAHKFAIAYCRGERGIDPYKCCTDSPGCIPICGCIPPGGQSRPPLRVRTVLHWCAQICHVVPPGEVEPRPYATGVDSADSHWCVPFCRCVPHNPSVTASPCHLPLHKGGFGAPQTRQ